MRAAWLTLLVFLGLGLGGTTALAADETTAASDQGSGGSSTTAVLNPTGPAAAALTPVIGIDPTSLDFGRVCVGQCEDLVIELFNDVDDPTSNLEITSISVDGDGFTLFNPPSTPLTIAGGNPGPRVSVTVRFCPSTPGAKTGTFTVTGNGSNSPVTASVQGLGNSAPVCDAGGPYTGTAGQAVSFDGSGSSDPNGDTITYSWDFGDGSTGTGATPTHTYAGTGTFTVTLTVSDDCTASSQCSTTATIGAEPNDPPTCDAGGPYTGTAGQAVAFDGSGSSDPDGTIASYAWDFGDGNTGTGATPSHTYANAGSFTVSLTVTDDDGAPSTCTTTAEIAGIPNEPPTCDAGGPYTGTAGEAVSFDGSGSSDPDGTIASYAWDFGDGSTGTGATPTHTYANSGSFTVTLTVTDDDDASTNCTTTAEIGEAPNQPPVCDADGPYNGTVNVAVTFDGTGSSDPDGTVDAYAWDFGDGSSGTGPSPTHTYTAAGSFTVTLIVTDNDGATSTCTSTANITAEPNEPPTCDAGGPYTGTVNQAVAFDGSGSSDPDGTVDAYAWDFGDGNSGTGATPSHTYTTSGTFTVTLTVTDNDGGSSSCTATAEIAPANEPPVCDAGGPYNGTVNQAVSFDGSGSSDPDGNIVSYDWNFGDGSTGTGATPSHTYTTTGTFTVTLFLTDDDGDSSTCTTSANITETQNIPPTCDAGGPYTGTAGQAVSFDGSGSSDPDGTVDSYDWDFGDGSTGTGATPTHTYAAGGTFTVTLTVTDNQGGSSSCTATATIEGENQPPACDAGGPYNGTVNQAVSFDGTGSTDPDGTIDSYGWDFGDGSTGSGASPTHTYTTTGSFTVTLSVTDNDGATSTCTTTANITEEANLPPVCDANGPYSGTVGEAIAFDGSGSSDPDGTVDSYDWDFGDGSTGTGATPSHTYASAGNFTVTLTVTDNDGATSICTSSANVTEEQNEPPVCDAGGPYSGTVGQAIAFDGSGSSDPDGTVDSYAWDFGDGSSGTGATPTHTYASAGNFTVTLTVTDNDGSSSTCTTTANVSGTGGNQPPDCSNARPSQGEIWPPNGQFTRVSILGVTDPNGDPVSITIDGVTQDEPLSGPGYGNKCPDARLNGTLELRAERGGQGDGRIYEISFTATDGQGGSCSGTVTVCVPKNQAPNNECHDSGQNYDSLGPCGQVRGVEDAPKLALSAVVVSGGVQVDYELAQDSRVNISVFDVTGRRIAALVSSHQVQGAHQLSWDAQGVARGIYYMRIETPTGNLTKRIVFVR